MKVDSHESLEQSWSCSLCLSSTVCHTASQVGWLVVMMFGWFVVWLVGWMDGKLVDLLAVVVGVLVSLLVVRFIGWLVGCF